ncbi:hypothetical protein ACRASO_004325 [Yersinia enterocolitica]
MLSKDKLEKIANPAQADIGGTQSPIITQMAIELLESRAEALSLREQLAELKALEPVAVMFPDYEIMHKNEFMTDGSFDACCEHHTPLFTAAKPGGESHDPM